MVNVERWEGVAFARSRNNYASRRTSYRKLGLPLGGTVDCQVSTIPALGFASGFSLFHIEVQNPSVEAIGVASVFSDKCTDIIRHAKVIYCALCERFSSFLLFFEWKQQILKKNVWCPNVCCILSIRGGSCSTVYAAACAEYCDVGWCWGQQRG